MFFDQSKLMKRMSSKSGANLFEDNTLLSKRINAVVRKKCRAKIVKKFLTKFGSLKGTPKFWAP